MPVSALPGLVSQVQEDGGHRSPHPGPTGQASAGNSPGTSAAGKLLELHDVGEHGGGIQPCNYMGGCGQYLCRKGMRIGMMLWCADKC